MAGKSTDGFKAIGRRLAVARADRGLTQRALAALLGKPHSYIDKLEVAERRLDILDLKLIASALDLAPNDLLDRLLTDEDDG